MLWRTTTDIQSWLPQLQCHRGYWIQGLQQNSLASVKEAYLQGYPISEFDVRLTADEKVVLFHDEKYKDQFVEKTKYNDFKTLIRLEYPQLSFFEEVLGWMKEQKQKNPDFNFKLNVEIKSKKIWEGRLEKKVCQLIEKFQLEDQVIISSFNPFTLFRIRLISSKLRRALLVTHGQESNFFLNKMIFNFLCQPDVLHLRWNDLDEKLLQKMKKKIPIVLWTVNDFESIQKWKSKIYGIISDQITPSQYENFRSKKD